VISPAPLLGPESAVVFLFHGVLREARETGVRNYTGKHLPLPAFESFLDELLDVGSALSIEQVTAAANGSAPFPDNGFAITFDDGFANNLGTAAPALESRGIPATFYVTTDFVDRQQCSWIDLIEFAVDRVQGATLTLPFLEATLGTHEDKIAALDVIRARAKSDPAIDPYALAADVWRQVGVTEFVADEELDRKLTWDDVRTLAAHSLFTVGGHGATHRVLSHLDERGLEQEIEGSLDLLDRETGVRTMHFSYPEGSPSSYSNAVVDRLRRRGVSSAVAVLAGAIRRGDDPFALKRTLVA
jgi:peptidoglycan/xylan/chitin deacetylase (PgdA/CDA1 family)